MGGSPRRGGEGGGGGGGCSVRLAYVVRTMCRFDANCSSSGSASFLYHVVPSICLVKQTLILTIRQKTLLSEVLHELLLSLPYLLHY